MSGELVDTYQCSDPDEFDFVCISDLHLGHGFTNIELVTSFFAGLKTKKLYLLGDIFELWEYSTVPQYFHLFDKFPSIIYLPGNHDLEILNASIMSANIKREEVLWLDGYQIHMLHGDVFDETLNQNSFLIELLYHKLYNLSHTVNSYLKNHVHFLVRWYYSWIHDCFVRKLREKKLVEESKILVMGHTHCPGKYEVENLKIFNVGSWIVRPYAFFSRDKSYAFQEITQSSLYPKFLQPLKSLWT